MIVVLGVTMGKATVQYLSMIVSYAPSAKQVAPLPKSAVAATAPLQEVALQGQKPASELW